MKCFAQSVIVYKDMLLIPNNSKKMHLWKKTLMEPLNQYNVYVSSQSFAFYSKGAKDKKLLEILIKYFCYFHKSLMGQMDWETVIFIFLF